MANTAQAQNTEQAKGFMRFFNAVERLGNKLPHPFYLFLLLAGIVLALSALMGGMEVTYTAASSTGGEAEEVTVAVVNLLNGPYIASVMKSWTNIYVSFAPLGLVMVMMLSIGFAQDTGFFDAFMRNTLLGAPAALVTFVLAIVCICGNLVSSAGIIFGATMGAMLFAALRRNPIIGAVAGYAAVHGGYGANLILNGDDVLLSGITGTAAESLGINAPNNPMMNYFFMFTATFLIALVVTFVTEKIMPGLVKSPGIQKEMDATVTPAEKRGLKFALIALIAFLVVMVAICAPKSSFLRSETGELLPKSPLVDSTVCVLFIFFVTLAAAYGVGAGTIKKASDVPKFMQSGLSGSLSFFVIAFPAALFIHFFNSSKLATILAVKGGELLKSLNFTGIPLAIAFIFLSGMCNLFMTSSSAKWLILAPIFVPMFAQVGFSPALTQIAFRIGDSMSNPIAPINFFLPMVLGLMNAYKRPEDPEFGIGTLISYTLPYSIGYMIVLILQLVIWMLLGLPLGPGVGLYM